MKRGRATYLFNKDRADRASEINSRTLHIIRQIKRFEEYSTLERVYGGNIIFVGCYSSKGNRVAFLKDRMKSTERTSSDSGLESKALEIMSIDEDESEIEFGQKVIECYPKADFILDCTSLKTLEDS